MVLSSRRHEDSKTNMLCVGTGKSLQPSGRRPLKPCICFNALFTWMLIKTSGEKDMQGTRKHNCLQCLSPGAHGAKDHVIMQLLQEVYYLTCFDVAAGVYRHSYR